MIDYEYFSGLLVNYGIWEKKEEDAAIEEDTETNEDEAVETQFKEPSDEDVKEFLADAKDKKDKKHD